MAPLPAPAEKPSQRVSDSQSHAKVRPPAQVAVFCAALRLNLQPANADCAEDAFVYIFQNPPREPKWLALISPVFENTSRIINQSSSAVLTFKTAGVRFAVTFGYAWLYLDTTSFVADFGLRVALNAADDRKLRRLDIANLGEAIKGVTQSASQRRFETFGVDEALELVRKITGAVREEEFGSSVTGSNSLKIRTETDFRGIPALAERALNYYRSHDYRRTSFRVVDDIFPEMDTTRVLELDETAAQSIAQERSDFELGLPEFTEDDFSAFSFVGFRHRNSNSDLQLSHYIAILGDRLPELDSSDLKNHKVRAEYWESEKPPRTLRIYDALVGSVELGGARYAINEGKWYRVDAAFKDSVDRIFHTAYAHGSGRESLPPDVEVEVRAGERVECCLYVPADGATT